MKKSELVKIIESLGLAYQLNNTINTLIQVWQPFKNNGFKIGNTYYSAEVLGANEVNTLNAKFEKLRDILIENKIIIRSSHVIENGVISEWVLEVKNGKTNNFNDDFEIETDIKNLRYGQMRYNDVIPNKVGYSYKDTPAGIKKERFKYKLKKPEQDLVITNINELLSDLSEKENIEWLHNFLIIQNNIEPFNIVIKNNIITVKVIVETLFNSDLIDYDSQYHPQYKKLFNQLSLIKIDDITILKNLNKFNKQYLPDFLIQTASLFKNIMTNWDFSEDTGQNILFFLVEQNYPLHFKTFIKLKDPNKHAINDWYLKQEIITTICNTHPKYLSQLIDDKWISLDTVYFGDIIDFLVDNIGILNIETYKIVLKNFLERSSHQDDLLNELFKKFDDDDLHDSFLSRDIMDEFIKYTILEDVDDFKNNDAAIMMYLKDNDPLKIKLLSDASFINYLISINKTKYIPKHIIDLFIF